MRAAAAVLVCALAATAHAQAPGETVPVSYAPPAPPPQQLGTKSPTTALLLSLGGTAVGAAIMSGGMNNDDLGVTDLGFVTMSLGPTFGHWYAGKLVTPGLGLRAGGLLVFALGLQQTLKCTGDVCGSNSDLDSAMMYLGALAYVGGGVLDLVTAPGAASDWNRAHAGPILTPTALPAVGGPAPGLALVGSF